jgi:hypothetical protein
MMGVTEKDIPVSRADLQAMFLDGYEAGAEYALGLYAYSSSAAWAENGVQYVGSTGRTLAQARLDMREHVNAMREASA